MHVDAGNGGEVRKDLTPMLRGNGFGMELYAKQRKFYMTQCHENAVLVACGGHDLRREIFGIDNQRVIARRFEAAFDVFEYVSAIVLDDIEFAMDGFRSADDVCAKRLCDSLESKTHAEDGDASVAFTHEIQADASVVGILRARREDDGPGLKVYRFFNAQGVIANNARLKRDIAKEMDEVVGKAIIVIDEKDHDLSLVAHSGGLRYKRS